MNTTLDIRAVDTKGGDIRYKVSAPPDSIIIVDSQGKPAARPRHGMAYTNFDLLTATAVAAGTNAFFTHSGTGTEVIAKAAKGGENLKSQSTTPADGDNVLLAPVTTSGFVRAIAAANPIAFEARVAVNTITALFLSLGLSENFTDADPTGTAGEGALFAFDPAAEFATAVNSALTGTVLGNWLLCHKVNGVDTAADTGIPVVAGRDYVLRIELDANLKANFYIDGVYVGQGPALTSGDSVGAFAGLELTAAPGEQKDLDLRYLELSKVIG